MGIFPERLKYATVKPLYKKSDTSNMANYRTIFFVMTSSKVVEATMYHTLNHHLKVNNTLVAEIYGFKKGLSTENGANTLVAEIYGFRKGLSTENAACTLIESTVKARNSKLNVGGIFCDLSKAFDYVNHEILIMKL